MFDFGVIESIVLGAGVVVALLLVVLVLRALARR